MPWQSPQDQCSRYTIALTLSSAHTDDETIRNAPALPSEKPPLCMVYTARNRESASAARCAGETDAVRGAEPTPSMSILAGGRV